MLIIRRRRPSGPARRIVFGGPNVNVDAPCPEEAQASLRLDAIGRAEWRATPIIDAFSGIETRVRLINDITSSYEFVSVVRADYSDPLESQGGASVLTDAGSQIEFRTTPLVDAIAAAESLSRNIADSSPALENTIAMGRADGLASAEVLHTSVFDVFAREENAGLVTAVSDSSGYLESLQKATSDSLGQHEFASRQVADSFAATEFSGTASTVFDTLCRIELLVVSRGDSAGAIDQLATARRDAVVSSEITTVAQVTVDGRAFLETLTFSSQDASLFAESLETVTTLAAAVSEVLQTARDDGITPIAIVGSAVMTIDTRGYIEFLGGQKTDTPLTFEAPSSVAADAPGNILETLRTTALHAASPAEAIASLLADFPGPIESLSLHHISAADAFGNIEIAGHSTTYPALLLGIIEYSGGIRVDMQTPAEAAAIVAYPFDPAGRAPIEASWLFLDKTRTSISSARVRLITAPYTAPEIEAQPFDPLAVGSLDTFGFDFSADVGQATIVSTSWTATFDPGSSSAEDDTPQARIITSWTPTTIYILNPLDGSLATITGTFSTAAIGTFPASAVGGTYNIQVQVTFSDTRSLLVTTSILCVSAES